METGDGLFYYVPVELSDGAIGYLNPSEEGFVSIGTGRTIFFLNQN